MEKKLNYEILIKREMTLLRLTDRESTSAELRDLVVGKLKESGKLPHDYQ
jgi:hypothetical protein